MNGIVYTETARYSDTDDSLYGLIAKQHWNMWSQTAGTYVWGRQDCGDQHAKRTDSYLFGSVYALAKTVTDGAAPPLVAAFHEYVMTGRILVRVGGNVAQVYVSKRAGTSMAECVILPWSGDHLLPLWHGIEPLLLEPLNDDTVQL